MSQGCGDGTSLRLRFLFRHIQRRITDQRPRYPTPATQVSRRTTVHAIALPADPLARYAGRAVRVGVISDVERRSKNKITLTLALSHEYVGEGTGEKHSRPLGVTPTGGLGIPTFS
jgi:hypothetical protein